MKSLNSVWLGVILAVACSQGTRPALASDLFSDTFLIGMFQGSNRSTLGRSLGNGGFELSTGEFFSLRELYTPDIPQVSVLFLRQLSPSFGVIWGLGTPEKAPKYEIEPSLYLGFLYQHELFDNAFVSVRGIYPIGGKLRELSCIGDFGEIGGVQEVNCRLAADILPPAETLNFLATASGEFDASISINFTWSF